MRKDHKDIRNWRYPMYDYIRYHFWWPLETDQLKGIPAFIWINLQNRDYLNSEQLAYNELFKTVDKL